MAGISGWDFATFLFSTPKEVFHILDEFEKIKETDYNFYGNAIRNNTFYLLNSQPIENPIKNPNQLYKIPSDLDDEKKYIEKIKKLDWKNLDKRNKTILSKIQSN